jgi:hypothetical protein
MNEKPPKNRYNKENEEFADEFSALIQKVEAGVKDEVDAAQLANVAGLKAPPKKKKPKTKVQKALMAVQNIGEKSKSLGSRKIVISTPNATIIMGLGFLLLTGGFAALKSWQRSSMPQRKNLAANYSGKSQVGNVFDSITQSGTKYKKGSAKKWALDKKAEESKNKYVSNPSLVMGFIGFDDSFLDSSFQSGIENSIATYGVGALDDPEGKALALVHGSTFSALVNSDARDLRRYPFLRELMKSNSSETKLEICELR